MEESRERSLLLTLAIHNLKAETEIGGCYFELMTSQRHQQQLIDHFQAWANKTKEITLKQKFPLFLKSLEAKGLGKEHIFCARVG